MDFKEMKYKEGQELCKKCEGRKYHTDRTISIATVCNHCRGDGVVYWIDNMTGNLSPSTSNSDFGRNLAMQNAQYLLSEAKRLFMEAGIHALITVEQQYPPTPYIRSKYGKRSDMTKMFKI
jgi:hypothetical protein